MKDVFESDHFICVGHKMIHCSWNSPIDKIPILSGQNSSFLSQLSLNFNQVGLLSHLLKLKTNTTE